LQHVRYTGEEDLRLNQWGVAEPIGRQPVAIEDVQVVIVPALGADRRGHRIGYGYGYYDEFLAGTPAMKIAPVYAACLVDAVPSETYDVPMDVLVTENDITKPNLSDSDPP
jgi:5-formyltetrahydrofolate cyclo-ligase